MISRSAILKCALEDFRRLENSLMCNLELKFKENGYNYTNFLFIAFI